MYRANDLTMIMLRITIQPSITYVAHCKIIKSLYIFSVVVMEFIRDNYFFDFLFFFCEFKRKCSAEFNPLYSVGLYWSYPHISPLYNSDCKFHEAVYSLYYFHPDLSRVLLFSLSVPQCRRI